VAGRLDPPSISPRPESLDKLALYIKFRPIARGG